MRRRSIQGSIVADDPPFLKVIECLDNRVGYLCKEFVALNGRRKFANELRPGNNPHFNAFRASLNRHLHRNRFTIHNCGAAEIDLTKGDRLRTDPALTRTLTASAPT